MGLAQHWNSKTVTQMGMSALWFGVSKQAKQRTNEQQVANAMDGLRCVPRICVGCPRGGYWPLHARCNACIRPWGGMSKKVCQPVVHNKQAPPALGALEYHDRAERHYACTMQPTIHVPRTRAADVRPIELQRVPAPTAIARWTVTCLGAAVSLGTGVHS